MINFYMKKCCKCDNETRNRSSSYCKFHHNEYMKSFYKKNRKKIGNSVNIRRLDIRRIIIEAKNKPCSDCKQKYPYYVMDLDHVRGIKNFNLSVAARHGRSINKIMEEISKCDVVCANCHRLRTFLK